MSLKKLLAITLLAMSTSLSALASDVVVPVDPVIEGQEVPAKGLYCLLYTSPSPRDCS